MNTQRCHSQVCEIPLPSNSKKNIPLLEHYQDHEYLFMNRMENTHIFKDVKYLHIDVPENYTRNPFSFITHDEHQMTIEHTKYTCRICVPSFIETIHINGYCQSLRATHCNLRYLICNNIYSLNETDLHIVDVQNFCCSSDRRGDCDYFSGYLIVRNQFNIDTNVSHEFEYPDHIDKLYLNYTPKLRQWIRHLNVNTLVINYCQDIYLNKISKHIKHLIFIGHHIHFNPQIHETCKVYHVKPASTEADPYFDHTSLQPVDQTISFLD